MFKNRYFTVLLGAVIIISLILTLSFSGCSTKTASSSETTTAITTAEGSTDSVETSPTTSTQGTTDSGKEIVLRVLDPTWDPMQKLWKEKIIPMFEKAHPNVKIEYEWVEWGPASREKVVLAHTSGSVYDIFMIPTFYLPGMVNLKVLAPLDLQAFGVSSEDELSAKYLDGIIDTCKYNNEIYAITVENSGNVLIYNPKQYTEVGLDSNTPPKTFEEMLDFAKKLTKRDSSGTLERSGYYPQIYPGALGGFNIIAPMIRQLGGSYFDDTWTKPNFNTPEAKKAYEFFKEIFDPKTGTASLGFAVDENQMGSDFVSGRISQIYGASYMNSVFKGIDANFKDYVYAPVPPLKDAKQKVTVSWGSLYCVDSASENQKMAWELLNFVSSEQFATTWMLDAGMFTGLKGNWINDVLKVNPEYQVMFDELKYAKPALMTDKNDQIETALQDHLERIIASNMDIEKSLAVLQSDVEAIMKK